MARWRFREIIFEFLNGYFEIVKLGSECLVVIVLQHIKNWVDIIKRTLRYLKNEKEIIHTSFEKSGHWDFKISYKYT